MSLVPELVVVPNASEWNGLVDSETAKHTVAGYLAHDLPQRWEHTSAVAHECIRMLEFLPLSDRDTLLLINAAWFHDIGYSPIAQADGYNWHPLDGANLLHQWEMDTVADVVAWHTTAEEEASLLDLTAELNTYRRPRSLVADVLTYADMTIGANGKPCTMRQRLVEVRARHGAGSTAAAAMEEAWPRLLTLEARVQEYLAR